MSSTKIITENRNNSEMRIVFTSREALNEALAESKEHPIATSTIKLPDKETFRGLVRIAKKNRIYIIKTEEQELMFASISPLDPGLIEARHELHAFKAVDVINVAKDIAAMGYAMAFCGGYRAERIRDLKGDDVFAILREKPKINGNLQRADFIAELWFNNPGREATPKRWVMEVFGAQNSNEMIKIKEMLKEKYSVEIEIDLIPKSQEEAFTLDMPPAYELKYGGYVD